MERLTYTQKEMEEMPAMDCPVRQEDGSIVQKFCGEVCDEFSKDCPYKEMGKKLKEYEDAEEQGLLLRLPCKVGDVVYQVCDRIREFEITAIGVYVGKIVICTENLESGIGFSFDANRIGKRYFLTKAEAEKALAEMG